MFADADTRAVNEIRCLCADMVDQARSGHPGGSIGMVPMAYVLFSRVLRAAPTEPGWLGRDRFVLSNGHCSSLLYAMLHLLGYDYSMEDLKQFRQLHSRTPGHPERVCWETGHASPGVEVTTGPLGQGFANAVGLAIARRALRQDDPEGLASGGRVFAFVGDGCLQEGISSEAASLAGTLGLRGLVVLYDSNGITIDGDTALSFGEDVGARFQAYGWRVLSVANGDTGLAEIHQALQEALGPDGDPEKPTLIIVKTTIGYGAAKQGSAAVHGAPLGAEQTRGLKQRFGLDPEQTFQVSEQTRQLFAGFRAEKERQHAEWAQRFQACPYKDELLARFGASLTVDAALALLDPRVDRAALAGKATRLVSQACLQALHDGGLARSLVVGCADLQGSCMTAVRGLRAAQYVHYGVREAAMYAISNGIAAYGGALPVDATFMSFVGYAFGSLRVGALSRLHCLHVATHDSIAVGEDGCTHQPVEIAAQLRAMPGVLDWRPCDCEETVGAYAGALGRGGQHVLCLTRQGVPALEGTSAAQTAARGAYALHEPAGARYTLLASGSEVAPALAAGRALGCRVVSVPSFGLFCAQPPEYQRAVLGAPRERCVSVEPYVQFGWERFAARHVGVAGYGVSAPAAAVARHLRMDAEGVRERVAAMIAADGAK